MNILHLNEWVDLKGGVEIYIDQLQKLLRDKGHKSFLIGIHEYDGFFSIRLEGFDDVLQIEDHKIAFAIIDEFIRDNAINVISTHNIFNTQLIAFCLASLPVIKFAHGPVMVCPGKDKFWRHSGNPCTIKYGMHCFRHIYTQGCANRHPKRVIKAWNYVNFETKHASKRYKKVVVMSNYIKDGLLECGIAEDQILLNPYFTLETKEVHNIEPGRIKKLVFVGRLIPAKGPHRLIDALAPLLTQRDDVHLHIVGDGLMKPELTTMVNRLRLAEKIFLDGWAGRSRIDDILNEAYLVMFPSIYPEAFGIVGIEAMMRGKPVVGFDVGGVRTWLDDNVTGYLIDKDDDATFRTRTELLLDDPDIYSRMQINARRTALSRFVPKVHIEKLLNLYQISVK